MNVLCLKMKRVRLNTLSMQQRMVRRFPTLMKSHREKKPAYGLLRIWLAMQRTICGVTDSKHESDEKLHKQSKQIDLDEMKLSKSQREDVGILVHVLYSNPKVLYAPNNTAADKIIKKANETFELLGAVSQYAEKLLQITGVIREYLMLDKTEHNLRILKHIYEDLKQFPPLFNIHSDHLLPGFLKNNSQAFNRTLFLNQLDIIQSAACSWRSLMDGISLNVFQGFKSEDDLLSYFKYKAYSDNVTVLASAVFNMNKDGSMPNHMIYKIRQNATFTPETNLVRSRFWSPGPRSYRYSYYKYGFVWIQDVLERAMISLYAGRDVIEPGSFIQQFPYPCYLKDHFMFMIEHVMPLLLTVSWVYSVAMLVQNIVYEKEQRLKEVMKMMGLTNTVHWVAWFLTSFSQMSVTMAILTAILKYGKVLTYSDPYLIFLVLEVFAIANIMFSFLVSVFYSKAKIAAASAGIIYFLTYVPYMYIAVREEAAHDRITAWPKIFASLLSTSAFGLGAKYFAFYEINGVGVQWSNLAISPVEDDAFNMKSVLIMMLADAVIYAALVWYIENVHPGAYGLPKPWYFPFTRSYWSGHKIEHVKPNKWKYFDFIGWFSSSSPLSVMEEDQACAMDLDKDPTMFEPEPVILQLGVSIDKLAKYYKSTNKIAVNKLSLNLYEGQITSFLGHNGAGKTTTMSILTGLFPPTSGYAVIYGHDIRSEMDKIRKSLGMCPQHNVLFDELTVEEHLWFYSRLKGTSSKDIKGDMDQFISDIGLPEKKKSKVDCLSGGMKRKLSVAIAFVGGSRTVILDEPTAGIDPYSRRAIWDLILKYKKDRTILLSTHHMDEADMLGDRIAIMSNGSLKCCGSSLFLKNNLGDGYHLYLVKKPNEQSCIDNMSDLGSEDDNRSLMNKDGALDESFSTDCSQRKVAEFIKKIIPSAYLMSETKHELHYILPLSELKKGNYSKLFNELEASLDSLHLKSYGIKNATLEEVFLRVTQTTRSLESCTDSESSEAGKHDDDDVSPLTDKGYLTDMSPELNRGYVCDSEDEIEMTDQVKDEKTPSSLPRNNVKMEKYGGCGSYRVEGKWLYFDQFVAIMMKRYHCTKRNKKGLFSQILLPAFFVVIAMSVALTAPKTEDLPPIILSPSEYYNYTQPEGNVIPYSNHFQDFENNTKERWSKDGDSRKLVKSLHLPSGVGATCVLKSPFNDSIDIDMLNFTKSRNFKLISEYFEPMCQSVFVPGVPLENFVPPIPIVTPPTLDPSKHPNVSVILPVSDKPVYYPICHCTKDKFVCNSYYDKPKDQYRVVSGDRLIDITGQNEHKYYLYTTDLYRLRRYGAFAFGYSKKDVPKDFGKDTPPLLRKVAVKNIAKVWYNHKGYHSIPTYVNTINNDILRSNLPPAKGNPAGYGITLINHPMPGTNAILSLNQILQGTDVLIAIFIIAAMSFVPASFVLYLVYERYTKAKHLQAVSGLNLVVYWVSNYIWDMCNYIVPATCCVLILLIFDIPAYTSSKNFPAVVSLFLLYGWSITPVMYPASFVFKEPSTAYIFLILINLFIGITCVITSFMLEPFRDDETLVKLHNILKDIFLIFPNYCLGRGLMDVAFNEYSNFFLFKTGQYDQITSPFAWNLVTRKLVAMAISGITFFIITLLCEFRFFIKRREMGSKSLIPIDEEDSDVADERRRVKRGKTRGDLLVIKDLTKVYNTRKLGKNLAVNQLCLGVPEGECFGLLGVNGAGKSTTFKILTGDIPASAGDSYLNGYSIKNDLKKVQQHIGYCPQFDAIYDELTAREHLTIYCKIRGIPLKEQRQVVRWALEKLDLTHYADKPSGTYSGGNKRKLSTAIALIGAPPVIFLDEPTTGMDPYSRRFLWDHINCLVKEGRSVVLTSHSMEECEELCSRLAIMVNGQFKCLGSVQHLKNRFGEGYCITIRTKVNDNYDHSPEIFRFIKRSFPESVLKEQHYNQLKYELNASVISLAHVFTVMEQALDDLPIEDYSVSQNTLDNVFINFVKQQTDHQGHHLVTKQQQSKSQENLYDDDLAVRIERSGGHLSFMEMDVRT
ncbi:ABCA2 (predicted) [Pycnogonum litorale]